MYFITGGEAVFGVSEGVHLEEEMVSMLVWGDNM